MHINLMFHSILQLVVFKCRWRLFDLDNVIYCTFSSEGDFNAPEGLTEIKASEFYSIMESKKLIIN